MAAGGAARYWPAPLSRQLRWGMSRLPLPGLGRASRRCWALAAVARRWRAYAASLLCWLAALPPAAVAAPLQPAGRQLRAGLPAGGEPAGVDRNLQYQQDPGRRPAVLGVLTVNAWPHSCRARASSVEESTMKISVFGSGHVGLAGRRPRRSGLTMYCMDIDRNKVERSAQGLASIYEPGSTPCCAKAWTAAACVSAAMRARPWNTAACSSRSAPCLARGRRG
ncbi:hypothetical protein ACPA9J_16545 [Pseudomonas aeruginosa]